tara:strand:+ start:1416 stop:1796 length:381 start_codon:yes stop_codon:yes gene_type:complete
MLKAPISKVLDMSGSESQRLFRKSYNYEVNNLIFKTYRKVKEGSYDKNLWTAELNKNGKMTQGGMARGKNNLNSWTAIETKYLLESGWNSDVHGNFYLKSKRFFDKSDKSEVVSLGIKTLMKLQKI